LLSYLTIKDSPMHSSDLPTTTIQRFLWMMEQYLAIASVPKDYGTGTLFSRLDIHIIDSIGSEPGINVTALAVKHGITKSAVSQVVRSLEERKLIARYKSPSNQKEVLFHLLEQGKTAFDAHRKFHQTMEASTVQKLSAFSREEMDTVAKFITVFEERARQIIAYQKRRDEKDED